MAHVGHPADADGLRPSVEVGVGQLTGAAEQGAVSGPRPGVGHPRLAAGDALDHLGDQPPFIGFAGASGHQDDDLVAISVRGHGAPPARAAPDLDQRGWIDHAVTLSGNSDNTCRGQAVCGELGRHFWPVSRRSWRCRLCIHRLSTNSPVGRPEVIHSGLHKCVYEVEGLFPALWIASTTVGRVCQRRRHDTRTASSHHQPAIERRLASLRCGHPTIEPGSGGAVALAPSGPTGTRQPPDHRGGRRARAPGGAAGACRR